MRPRGILFDKDNTLVDLALFVRRPAERFAEELAGSSGVSKDKEALRRSLLLAIGLDGRGLVRESPVVADTNRDVAAACAKVLEEAGPRFPGNSRTVLPPGLPHSARRSER